ncbi:alanine--tRNA ligase-like protein, partial [Tanacetum coccineum]
MNHYAAKYNYASAKRNNKEDEDDRRKEEAAFNICSSLSVRKSAGKKMFDKAAKDVKDQGKNILSGQASLLQLISDFDAFILYGTYGYPLGLIKEVAAKEKLIVDVDGFNNAKNEEKERSKNSKNSKNK